jgi:hypothetical protein
LTAVRYVALAALVVWLAALAGALAGDALRHIHFVSAACGGVIVLSLIAMKFIGPPPRAFLPRIAIVAVMLATMGWTMLGAASTMRTPALAATAALGFVLLAWYATER